MRLPIKLLLILLVLLTACGGAELAPPTAISQTATPVPTQPRPVPSPTLSPSPTPLPDPTVTPPPSPPPSPPPVPSPTPLPVEWRPPATQVLLTGQSVLYRVGDAAWRSDVHLLFAEQLTTDDFLALHPQREGDPEAAVPYLSPDGRWLAQLCAPDAVCLADLGTGATRVLSIAASELAWSPGSDSLAYVALSGAPWEVRLYELASGEDRLLAQVGAEGSGRPINLLWSPAGARLAFICCYGGRGNSQPPGVIQVVTLADGNVDPQGEAQVSIAGGAQDYCWTMSGTITMDETAGVACTRLRAAALVRDTSEQGLVAFWEIDPGPAGEWQAVRVVVSAGLDGERLWELAVDSDQPLRLRWAPDGRYLFYSQGGPQAGLWRVNADGSDPRLLIADALLLDVVDAWQPLLPRLDVSPDGRWLAETIVGAVEQATEEEIATQGVYEKRRVQLVVRRTDGAVVWNVVDEYRGYGLGADAPQPFAWSADGTALYFSNVPTPDGCTLYVNGGDLWRLDLRSGAVTQVLPWTSSVMALAPDQMRVAYAGRGGDIVIRNLETDEETVIDLPERIGGAALGGLTWAPDGLRLLLVQVHSPCTMDSVSSLVRIRLDAEPVVTTLFTGDVGDIYTIGRWIDAERVWLAARDGVPRWVLDVVSGALLTVP